ncbi:MAG: protein kinase [Byssovorax sp.]
MSAPLTVEGLGPGIVLLEKYRLLRELGSGGMGIVYAAEHLVLGHLLAIKFLLPELAALPESTSRFLREAKAASRIQGEHIVRVLDYGILKSPAPPADPEGASPGASPPVHAPPPGAGDPGPAAEAGAVEGAEPAPPIEGQPFIVMEYLEGKDLGRYLKAGARFSIQEAIDFIVQAAFALAQAHRAGVIHRDVKPANLFVTTTADGRTLVKMLDFGISKVVEDAAHDNLELTRTSAVMGSALYMSLEQMRSTKSVDYRTDIYSLGVSLYELLTHTHPFTAESFSELCVKVSLDPPDPITRHRPEIPPALGDVIARSYARYPDDRYPTVGSFASALAPFASEATKVTIQAIERFEAASSGQLPAVRPPPGPRPNNGRRPLPVPGWLMGGLFGALVAIVGFSFWLRRVTPPIPPADAGAPTTDASADAPSDAQVEAPPDASADAPPDASADAPSDASVDAHTPQPPQRPWQCRGKPKGEIYVDARGIRRPCP